jgi:large subunit ribosomal protein L35
MPKYKTNRSTAKRLRLSGSGKVLRHKAGARHKALAKSRTRKRRLSGSVALTTADAGRALRLLGKR